MLRNSTTLLAIALLATPALANEPSDAAPPSVLLEGLVSDSSGAPLAGALVSVFGQNLAKGALVAITDDDGEFRFDGVPPGTYRVRAYLAGFLPSSFAKVIVDEGMDRVGALLMSLAPADGTAAVAAEAAGSERTLDELIWLVARGKRNILKDEEEIVPAPSLQIQDASTYASAFTFRGEFGVRTATPDAGLDEFPGAGAGLDARLAFARLYIPTRDDGHWLVSAQVLESALASWAGRAEYVKATPSGHQLAAGVTYGNYLYGDLEQFRPPETALTSAPTSGRSLEWFGTAYLSDQFEAGDASIQTSVSYEHFSYLQRSGYASPRAEVSYPLGAERRTFLVGGAGLTVLAPGGEDIGLLSQVALADVYGPSPTNRSPLVAERTARYYLGVEREVSQGTRVAMRVFQEDARDQLVKRYAKDRQDGMGVGHFRVSNNGDFRTRGVGVTVSKNLGPLEGQLGYSFGMGQALVPTLAGAPLPEDKELHDVTTVVATSFDRTRTRVRAAYRLLSHPVFAGGAVVGGEGFTGGSTLDSRFNLQVFQVLPFVDFNGTSWELMVAIRNLFYEDLEGSSMLDEIAVIDAPKRVLGGVTVRF